MFYKNQSELRDNNRESEKRDWFKNHYTPYLNSIEWKEKRNKVLIRDKYICQSCLTNRATQVHHLTYAHVFNEPLFELTSICVPCHELITKLDNNKP
jgi:5-methylcytosine-specific restriction endonuclease McrA